jgi:hypothetical protein
LPRIQIAEKQSDIAGLLDPNEAAPKAAKIITKITLDIFVRH